MIDRGHIVSTVVWVQRIGILSTLLAVKGLQAKQKAVAGREESQ